MKETVKYQNNLNNLKFKNFSKSDLDIFMTLCSKTKDKDTQKIILDFDEIKTLTKYNKKKKSNAQFIKDLRQMNERLMQVNCEFATDTEIVMFVLFPVFKIDTVKSTLTVSVNEEYAWLLNEVKNYTTFELEEFVDLNSKYSKHLYTILKQWRTTGQYIVYDLDIFRELLDVPKEYSNKRMIEKCISVAVEELSRLEKSFENFSCEPIYAKKRGKPLENLKFSWKAENVSKASDANNTETNIGVEANKEQPSAIALKIARDIEKGNKKKNEKKKENKFNSFPQRKYDYNKLEDMLMNK